MNKIHIHLLLKKALNDWRVPVIENSEFLELVEAEIGNVVSKENILNYFSNNNPLNKSWEFESLEYLLQILNEFPEGVVLNDILIENKLL